MQRPSMPRSCGKNLVDIGAGRRRLINTCLPLTMELFHQLVFFTLSGKPFTLKCMVRRRTARGLKLGEGTVCVNVSGLLVENRSPGT